MVQKSYGYTIKSLSLCSTSVKGGGQRGKEKRLLLHPATEALLESMLLKLRDEGEDAAFSYIRRDILGKR